MDLVYYIFLQFYGGGGVGRSNASEAGVLVLLLIVASRISRWLRIVVLAFYVLRPQRFGLSLSFFWRLEKKWPR